MGHIHTLNHLADDFLTCSSHSVAGGDVGDIGGAHMIAVFAEAVADGGRLITQSKQIVVGGARLGILVIEDTSNGRNFAKHMKALATVAIHETVGSITVARRFQAAGAQTFYNCCDGAICISTAGDGTYNIQTQFLRQLSSLPAPSADGAYTVRRTE